MTPGSTYYEMVARTNLNPALGKYPLTRLSAARVQAFLNGELADGQSIRRVQIMRTVLSSALTRAMRNVGSAVLTKRVDLVAPRDPPPCRILPGKLAVQGLPGAKRRDAKAAGRSALDWELSRRQDRPARGGRPRPLW
jgi:hypothetical protein